MDIERKIPDEQAVQLRSELIKYADSVEGIDLEKAKVMIQRAQDIRNLAEKPQQPIDLNTWREVFEISERLILYLLATFKDEFLPDEKLVNALADNTQDRVKPLEALKQRYPYAVRITNEPHLYAVSLHQIDNMYHPDPKSARPFHENWEHEMGHYSNRLAVDKPIPKGSPTFFVAMIYKSGDGIGYRPAVFHDKTDLTALDKLFIDTHNIDELSRGDVRDVAHVVVTEPLKKIGNKIRSIFKNN